MRWLSILVLLLSAIGAAAQSSAHPRTEIAVTSSDSSSNDSPDEFPDAPGAISSHPDNVVAVAEASFKITRDGAKPCNAFRATKVVYFDPNKVGVVPKPCFELVYPYQKFLTTNIIIPMTWQQKGYAAIHNLADPENFGTIVGISAITIAADSHSAYGPGLKGFGKSVGVSYLQDATAQFFGVFAIPVLVHQDPRYIRMPHAPLTKRIIYSVSRTVIARRDDGTSMPNYATLLNYPIGAILSNQYVPGIDSSASSTVERIFTGYALDPVNNLLTEFLPDVASRVHIRIIFVQRILNNVAGSNNATTLP